MEVLSGARPGRHTAGGGVGEEVRQQDPDGAGWNPSPALT